MGIKSYYLLEEVTFIFITPIFSENLLFMFRKNAYKSIFAMHVFLLFTLKLLK